MRSTPDLTDWDEIVRLYDRLAEIHPSPVVQLNRAVAVAMAGRVDEALQSIDELHATGALAGYHHLESARAELLSRAGRTEESIAAYERALELASNRVERDLLGVRLEEARSGEAR
jgi:RNA polymerase sigma-70 factor (ECF subfamily)